MAPDSIFTTLSTPLGVEISDNCRDCAPDNRQIDSKIPIMLWQAEWIHYYCFDSRIPQKGLDNRLCTPYTPENVSEVIRVRL